MTDYVYLGNQRNGRKGISTFVYVQIAEEAIEELLSGERKDQFQLCRTKKGPKIVARVDKRNHVAIDIEIALGDQTEAQEMDHDVEDDIQDADPKNEETCLGHRQEDDADDEVRKIEKEGDKEANPLSLDGIGREEEEGEGQGDVDDRHQALCPFHVSAAKKGEEHHAGRGEEKARTIARGERAVLFEDESRLKKKLGNKGEDGKDDWQCRKISEASLPFFGRRTTFPGHLFGARSC